MGRKKSEAADLGLALFLLGTGCRAVCGKLQRNSILNRSRNPSEPKLSNPEPLPFFGEPIAISGACVP